MMPLETIFLALVRENRQRLLRVCRVYAWTGQDREDLFQEVQFQIWWALPTLKEGAYANTWLYRIALNTAISFVRKGSAAGRRGAGVDVELLEHRAEEAGADGSRMEALYEAIGKLDKAERAAITLFLEEMSYEEIGEVLGLNPGHVGVMLHRTKKKLFEMMKGDV